MDEVARVPVAHLLIYFGLGLILLSHTRLTVLRSGWVWERLTVARGLPAGWIAATLLMLRTYILHYPDLQQALAVAQRQFKNTSSVLMAMRKATRLVNTFLDFRGLRHDHPGCRVWVTPPDLSGARKVLLIPMSVFITIVLSTNLFQQVGVCRSPR